MDYKNLFGRLDSLKGFLYEEDEESMEDPDNKGKETDKADDQDHDNQDYEEDEIDGEYVDSFVNKLDLIVTRIDGVLDFVKGGDSNAALIAFEKIIEDLITTYYDMGGEGDALSKIKSKGKESDKNAKNKAKTGDKKKNKGGKKSSNKAENAKKKKEGDESEQPDNGDVQESLDLSTQDVGYNINGNYGSISENRNDPFGIPGLVSDVMKRSGIK